MKPFDLSLNNIKNRYKTPFFILLILLLLPATAAISAADVKGAAKIRKEYKAAADDETRAGLLAKIVNDNNGAAYDVVLEALKNGESSALRKSAADSLGKLKLSSSARKKSVKVLHKSFDEDDHKVRGAAMESLAIIGDPSSRSRFEKGFKDSKSETVRMSALKGLSKVGKSSHLKLFKKALKWNPKGQYLAIIGIGKVGKKKEWNNLQRYCNGGNKDIIIACLKAAASLQNESALEYIEPYITYSEQEVARTAIKSLASFKGFRPIEILVRLRKKDPGNINTPTAIAMLKKRKAARQYAILAFTMNLRKAPNTRAKVITGLKKDSVVEIIKRGRRKYTVKDSKGQELEDFWYEIKSGSGKKGFLFGGYIEVIDVYK